MNGWIGGSGRVGQRTGDKGQRRRTSDLGRRLARCLAFVLCPLSFVLALTAQAVEVNLTVGERYPKEGSYLSFSYSNGARWFKLATATASGAVSDIVQAQFADHHSTAVNLSNGVQKPTEFFFTATAPGDVTLTLYRCSDSGDLVPDMNAQYAYRGYSGKSGDNNRWMSCSDQEYTFHVTKPAEPQPVELPASSTLTYNGQSQTCIDNSAKKFTLGGTYQATAVGNYTATLTPADGYYWADKSEGAKDFAWSIVRKSATITANNASKVVGAADPTFTATVTGLVDTFTPTYTVERTDTSEAVGTYALTVTGEAEQGNYVFSYLDGEFKIVEAKTEYTGDVEVKEIGDDTAYIFKSGNGTLTLAKDAVVNILVVGGAGGGGAAYYNKNLSKYNGNGGNGGEVKYLENQSIAAGEKLAITVGKGGAGGAGATKGSAAPGGSNGEASSLSYGSVSISSDPGTGGAGGTSGSNNKAGTAGKNAKTLDITGDDVDYGQAGSKAPSSNSASDADPNTGNGGQGGRASSTQGNRDGGDGGSGIVVVRVLMQREEIPLPTGAAFTFDNTEKTGVADGEHYTRGGTYAATDAGTYTAKVTPAYGYCWPDKSHGEKEIKWTIAKRPVTVTVVNTNKVVGATFTDPDRQTYNDPIWTTTVEGLIASDTTTITWDIFRTNACEEVGTYDLLVEGEKQQGNYDITYVGGKYEILAELPPQGPTIPDEEGELAYDPDEKEVVVTPKENVTEVEIINMPADATAKVPVTVDSVKGVEPAKIKVVYTQTDVQTPQTYDITKAFTITGNAQEGVTITLDGTASVEIPLAGGGSETVTVVPELTETGDKAVEPLEVEESAVDVGVKTIPGLTYELRRSETVETVSQGAVIDSKRAETTRTKLSDPFEGGKPPKAFYRVRATK